MTSAHFTVTHLMSGPRWQVEMLDEWGVTQEVASFASRDAALAWALDRGWQGCDVQCPSAK